MDLLILFGFVFLLSFIVNSLTGVDKRKNEEVDLVKITKDAQIETGYPTSIMRSLHINSTMEPPLPYHNYNDEQLGRFKEEEAVPYNKHNYTINMFVESHLELNLSLFERELTEQMVNDAYEKVLNEHLNNIEKGIPEVFNITDKKEAKDYLLNYVNNSSKN
jgi:hypothetical protein